MQDTQKGSYDNGMRSRAKAASGFPRHNFFTSTVDSNRARSKESTLVKIGHLSHTTIFAYKNIIKTNVICVICRNDLGNIMLAAAKFWRFACFELPNDWRQTLHKLQAKMPWCQVSGCWVWSDWLSRDTSNDWLYTLQTSHVVIWELHKYYKDKFSLFWFLNVIGTW